MKASGLDRSRGVFGASWGRLARAVDRELGLRLPAGWTLLVVAFAAGVALAIDRRRPNGEGSISPS